MQKNAHIHLCSCPVKCVSFSTQIPSASSSRKIAADIGFQHFDLLPICHCSLIHNPPSSVAVLHNAIPIVFTGKGVKKFKSLFKQFQYQMSCSFASKIFLSKNIMSTGFSFLALYQCINFFFKGNKHCDYAVLHLLEIWLVKTG